MTGAALFMQKKAIMNLASNRLALAATMAALLLLALSYWWLENLAHEIFGVAIFIMLARHIYMQRRWFGALLRGPYKTRRLLLVALHLILIANMVALLVTSIVISRSLFSFLPIPDSVPTRDIHWFSAYWVMVNVGVHLGIHWVRVMAMTRTTLGLKRESICRTWALRLVTLMGVAYGVYSIPILAVWTKLTFNFSLVYWNFNAAVLPFFTHWITVMMIPIAVTHYAIKLSKLPWSRLLLRTRHQQHRREREYQNS
jgi:hypothetical protein